MPEKWYVIKPIHMIALASLLIVHAALSCGRKNEKTLESTTANHCAQDFDGLEQ